MIYPTRLMILLAAAVAPAALVIGLFPPAWWTSGLALLALLAALAAVDAFTGPGVRTVEVACEGPGAVNVSETFAIVARIRFGRPAPATVEAALGVSGPVSAPYGWRARAQSRRSGPRRGDRAQGRAARHGAARECLGALDRDARAGLEAAHARRSARRC